MLTGLQYRIGRLTNAIFNVAARGDYPVIKFSISYQSWGLPRRYCFAQ